MTPPSEPRTVEERYWDLAHRVGELEKDMSKLDTVPIRLAVIEKDQKRMNSLLQWLIGVIGVFAVSLLIAAVTFALNALSGSGG